MEGPSTVIDMDDRKPIHSHTCPKCGSVSATDDLVRNGYECPACSLQVAHLDLAPNGAVRGVLGWLREPGFVLNQRYRVSRVLGSGGFAATYMAEDLLLTGKCRAIKEIPTLQYDRHEAELLSRLHHPAIPDISDRFEADGMIYLVLAFGGDRTLETVRKESGGVVEIEQLMAWMQQLCEVLEYLHGRTPPVVHRDLKPENVLLDEHGHVVLIDFGIAKESDRSQMTHTLARAASHGFSPPEQVLGTGTDQRSDVYALGATVYALVTGAPPPPAHERVAGKELVAPRMLNPRIPAELDAAIVQALDLNINRRPQTIRELREALAIDSAVSATVAHDAPLYDPTVRLPAGTRESTGSVAGQRETSGGKAAVLSTALETADVGRRQIGPRRRVARMVTTTALLSLLGVAGFAGAYVYSRPETLSALGAGRWANILPWRHTALMRAREHPLEFSSLSLALCNVDGTPLSPPKESFTDVEIGKAGHLRWTASFRNELAGLEDRKDTVSAQFFDHNGSLVASSSAERVVGSNDKSASFSAVAADFTGHPLGRYRVVLTSGDKRLAEREFNVTEDLAAKAEVAPKQSRSIKPPITKVIPNPRLSDSLSDYLHHHRLPYVDALARSDQSGEPRSILLSGRVATEQGKRDAESKARDYLNAPDVSISNRIRVDSTLARHTIDVSSQSQRVPSASCFSRCQQTYTSCMSACQSQNAEAQVGGVAASILGGNSGSRVAGVVPGLVQSVYATCVNRCQTQDNTCTRLCD
jgi:serine/threonine protein kinase